MKTDLGPGDPALRLTPGERIRIVRERCDQVPYLELFARRNRLGWDTWGNEALEHVEIAT